MAKYIYIKAFDNQSSVLDRLKSANFNVCLRESCNCIVLGVGMSVIVKILSWLIYNSCPFQIGILYIFIFQPLPLIMIPRLKKINLKIFLSFLWTC